MRWLWKRTEQCMSMIASRTPDTNNEKLDYGVENRLKMLTYLL